MAPNKFIKTYSKRSHTLNIVHKSKLKIACVMENQEKSMQQNSQND